MSEEIYNNEASQDEVSAELDAMVCDLIDDMLNSLADGEDLAVELDAGELQAVHELGVGLATYSKRGPPRGPPCAPAPGKRESRPPVSGALLSHGLTPQYHRRGAA